MLPQRTNRLKRCAGFGQNPWIGKWRARLRPPSKAFGKADPHFQAGQKPRQGLTDAEAEALPEPREVHHRL